MPRFGTFVVQRDGSLRCVAERPDRESRVRERECDVARLSRASHSRDVEPEPDETEPVLHTGVYL